MCGYECRDLRAMFSQHTFTHGHHGTWLVGKKFRSCGHDTGVGVLRQNGTHDWFKDRRAIYGPCQQGLLLGGTLRDDFDLRRVNLEPFEKPVLQDRFRNRAARKGRDDRLASLIDGEACKGSRGVTLFEIGCKITDGHD